MNFLNLIYPEKCVACGTLVEKGYLCPTCALTLEYVTAREDFELKRHAYEALAVPLYYSGAAKDAMMRLKFGSDISSARFFASEVEGAVRTIFYGVKFDTFTCVPATRESIAKRGYNQSKVIAENVRIDAVSDFGLLAKSEDTGMQHLMGKYSRSQNVSSAYGMGPGRDVHGQTILLVDDILTTGATCDACARALLLAGADKVYVACATLTKGKIIV